MKVLLPAILLFFINFIQTTGGECGSAIEPTVRKRDDRIVGGFDVGYYKYPWYVALIRKDIVSCGGTLIGPKTVLTAAHCFKQYLVSSKFHKTKLEDVYSIKLGVYNMCETESTQGLFKAEKVKIHELYLQKVPYYDICIITLTKNADQFTPICLPEVGFKKPKEGSTPGLGVLKFEGATPCTLHEGRLLIHSEQSCKKMLIAASGSADNFTNAFCAGYMQGGIDTCQGDSGGPLQVTAVNGKYIILGIVSFGFRCANPGLLGIYTDVSKYVEWIKEHSGSDQFEHIISDGSSTNGGNTNGGNTNGTNTNGDNNNGSSSNGDNSGSDTNENSDGQISATNPDISDVNNQIQTGYAVENPFQIIPQRIPYKRPLRRPINLIIINERKKSSKMKKHHKPKN